MTLFQPYAGTIRLSLELSYLRMGLLRLDVEMNDRPWFELIASYKEVSRWLWLGLFKWCCHNYVWLTQQCCRHVTDLCMLWQASTDIDVRCHRSCQCCMNTGACYSCSAYWLSSCILQVQNCHAWACRYTCWKWLFMLQNRYSFGTALPGFDHTGMLHAFRAIVTAQLIAQVLLKLVQTAIVYFVKSPYHKSLPL